MPHRAQLASPAEQSEVIQRDSSIQEHHSQTCGRNILQSEEELSSFYGAGEDSNPKSISTGRKRGSSGDPELDQEWKKEHHGGREGNLQECNDYDNNAAVTLSREDVSSLSKSNSLGYTGTDPKIRQGREPLKKRKKHLDVLRRNHFEFQSKQTVDEEVKSAYQVSPTSSTSNSFSRTQDDKQSESSNDTLRSVPSSELESPETKEVKVLTSGEIAHITPCPPSRVMNEITHQLISDFPQILHYVLSGPMALSQVTQPILQWLPHGQAWRISRWDALRDTVIPRFFSKLCNEDDSSVIGGSIEAFLWNVRSWGFKEITEGCDTGSFSNDHFIRSKPNLCKEMKHSVTFLPEKCLVDQNISVGERNSTRVASETVLRATSPSDPPSNIIAGDRMKTHNSPVKQPARYWGGYYQPYPDDYVMSQPLSDYYNGYHFSWQHNMNSDGQYNQNEPHHGQRTTYNSCYGSNLPSQSSQDYNKVRPSIRSSRGGIRLKESSSGEKSSVNCSRFSSNVNKVQQFPVSQRGRGTRHPTRNS
eukprot:CAMPEP_0178909682 /NCGR_PEP_ID=MMETSP0786-20121207/8667_1 /TAXON_ID=186022 /ORGANISM="Thalassionema frauenfeldii, Strain CCMP 1798" /LENGTH=531 /DNA_ID=CAMNT_0020581829 /DNA_START=114 /DNA_END=1709 /DNA_ORIENTATION=+